MCALRVSRIVVVLVLAVALGALPAVVVSAAPTAPVLGADGWWTVLWQWVLDWTGIHRSEPQRVDPGSDWTRQDPNGATALPIAGDDGLRSVSGDDGWKMDPDG